MEIFILAPIGPQYGIYHVIGANWGLDLAINGNRWKQMANEDLIKSVCYLPLFAVVFRYLPTLLPDTE